jgi:hypothetical protein
VACFEVFSRHSPGETEEKQSVLRRTVKKMTWTRKWETRNVYNILIGTVIMESGRNLDIDGRIILNLFLQG